MDVKPWWEEESRDKCYKAARALFEDYHSRDSTRLSAYTAFNRIYTNRTINGNDHVAAYYAAFTGQDLKHSRVPLNVAKILCDGAHARVTRQAIKIRFVTDDGDFFLQEGARDMEAYVAFQEEQNDIDKSSSEAYHDAIRYGTGLLKLYPHPVLDDINAYRVRACDFFVDPDEGARTNKPTNGFERMWVSKYQLAALFPDYERQIKKANMITNDQTKPTKVQGNSTMVEVVEGWKLPTWTKPNGENSGDGKRILFVDGVALEVDEYNHRCFPILPVRWKDDPTIGFWGIGLVEELMGLHFDINHLLWQVQKSVEMMPKPIFFKTTGAKLSEGMIGNAHGLIVETLDGNARVELPQSVPTDIVNLMQYKWGKALEVARQAALGLPESTGGGFETGQALRDFHDIQSTELAPNFKDWQDFRTEVAMELVAIGGYINERAKEEGRKYTVSLAADKFSTNRMDWDDIPLDPKKDSFSIKALPASALSQTFAGRKADVIDLMSAGLIDQEMGLALLDMPDLREFFSLVTAVTKTIKRDIHTMMRKGKMIPFDANNDLRLGLKLYQMSIAKYRALGAPEERIKLLEDARQQILGYIEKEQMQQRNMAAGYGPGLPGTPVAMDLNGSSPQAINQPGAMQ